MPIEDGALLMAMYEAWDVGDVQRKDLLGAEFHKRFAGRLFAYALLKLGDKQEAEDAVQVIMLNVLRRARWRPDGAPVAAWLLQVAHNHVNDCFRRRQSQWTMVPSGSEGGDLDDRACELPDSSPTPEDIAITGAEAAALRDLVNGLPPPEAEVLRLRFWGGLTLAETGAALGKSTTWAFQRQTHAVARLRRAILDAQHQGHLIL